MKYSNKPISLLLVVLITILTTTFAIAQQSDNAIIVGVTQKHSAEEQELSNQQNAELLKSRQIYNEQLLETQAESLRYINGLNNEYGQKRIKLIKRGSPDQQYKTELKNLEAEYNSNLAFLKKGLKDNERHVSFLLKEDKKRITQEYRPKEKDLKLRQKSEENDLKETHRSNKSVLKLSHDPMLNDFKEKKDRYYAYLSEEKKRALEDLHSAYKKDISSINSAADKRSRSNIYNVERNELTKKYSGINNVRYKEKELEERKFEEELAVETAALNRMHDIELKGGTKSEYELNKKLLAKYDLIYSGITINGDGSSIQETSSQASSDVFYQPDISTHDGYSIPLNTFPTGQCTWYVFGRVFEKQGKALIFSKDNGRDAQLWPELFDPNNINKIDVPRQGAIAVWLVKPASSQNEELGHVAFIEKVKGNTIYFTEANNSRAGKYDGDIEHLERVVFERGRRTGTGVLWEEFRGYYYPK